MTTRREESDGREVPEGRRKATPTADEPRGGKATTASKQAGQQELFSETADSPKGAVPGPGRDLSQRQARYAVPMSEDTNGTSPPAMTIQDPTARP